MRGLRDILGAHSRTFGTWAQIPSPEIIDMVGRAGFDFIVIDCQHAPFGMDTAENISFATGATMQNRKKRAPALLHWSKARLVWPRSKPSPRRRALAR
jgi:2-keto-3-deoxy-L-rhamnonate aldolase RhmA